MRRNVLRFSQWRLLSASVAALIFVAVWFVHHAGRAPEPVFYIGADVSSLPEIEKAGGRFGHGEAAAGTGAGDALAILHNNGRNLFRLRLFVNPQSDFNKSYGATQNLHSALNLAKRIKAATGGSDLLLDLHYSDTWADPRRQLKPAAWEPLTGDALEKQVYDYTRDVLKQFEQANVMPQFVQVGNEITNGMLWPDGSLLHESSEEQDRSWHNFTRLFNAGAKAVREAQHPTDRHGPRIVVHIHGGGSHGMAKWFFNRFNANKPDYDVIALSFYPTFGESLDELAKNMLELIQIYQKDVLIVETSYPWKPVEGLKTDPTAMRWPQTPEGQRQFVQELVATIRAPVLANRGIGFIWWYPEAVPVAGLHIHHRGAEALFDERGNALPALEAFANYP